MRLRGKIVAAACGSVLVIATAHSASAVQSTFVAQNEAHQRFTALSPQLRAQLAGHWFDAAAGKLTVAVPDAKTADQARAQGVNAVLVRRSAADLDRLLGEVRKLIGNG